MLGFVDIQKPRLVCGSSYIIGKLIIIFVRVGFIVTCIFCEITLINEIGINYVFEAYAKLRTDMSPPTSRVPGNPHEQLPAYRVIDS